MDSRNDGAPAGQLIASDFQTGADGEHAILLNLGMLFRINRSILRSLRLTIFPSLPRRGAAGRRAEIRKRQLKK
jgi:hypothetical protein